MSFQLSDASPKRSTNVPLSYFSLVNAFTDSGTIANLADMINTIKGGAYTDTSLLGTFSENHDQPRIGALTSDLTLAKNVIAGTMLTDGIPVIYQGQELFYQNVGWGGSGNPYPWDREAIWLSGYPTDGELYIATKTFNSARKNAANDDSTYLTYQNYPFYTDDTTIAMRKGKMVTILSNLGSSGSSYTLSLTSGYDSGTQVTELLTCGTLTASSDGILDVPMSAGQPRVYYPTASLGGFSLCDSSNSSKRIMKTRSAKWRYSMAKDS